MEAVPSFERRCFFLTDDSDDGEAPLECGHETEADERSYSEATARLIFGASPFHAPGRIHETCSYIAGHHALGIWPLTEADEQSYSEATARLTFGASPFHAPDRFQMRPHSDRGSSSRLLTVVVDGTGTSRESPVASRLRRRAPQRPWNVPMRQKRPSGAIVKPLLGSTSGPPPSTPLAASRRDLSAIQDRQAGYSRLR
ncbi:hypothetical protein MRX96_013112 [Rhipicephalus microplus]